ncbi:MAG: hypothetical protein P1S60_16780 [Anaerolineae bacterium]|nr:hypothetical protein [Anaerolineae bacterium]
MGESGAGTAQLARVGSPRFWLELYQRTSSADLDASWSYTPRFTAPGSHTLYLEAYDRAGNVRVDGPYQVNATYTALHGVEISGPTRVLTGTPATLQADYTPSDATGVDLLWHDSSDSSMVTYLWPEGIYTTAVTATDAGANMMMDTHTVTVVCPVVTEASVEGSTVAYPGTGVILTGTYSVTDDIAGGVVPRWDNGLLGNSTVYTWTETGAYTVVFTATGACGESVPAMHTVTVKASHHKVYLPLTIKTVNID